MVFRFRTRANSALPSQRVAFALGTSSKTQCLGDMSIFAEDARHVALSFLFCGTTMLNRSSEPESQETKNQKLKYGYMIYIYIYIFPGNTVSVIYIDHDHS